MNNNSVESAQCIDTKEASSSQFTKLITVQSGKENEQDSATSHPAD